MQLIEYVNTVETHLCRLISTILSRVLLSLKSGSNFHSLRVRFNVSPVQVGHLDLLCSRWTRKLNPLWLQ